MNDLLLRTLRGETTERRPVWIMRQAGRYLPEYRELRARHSFETLAGNPELAATVTLQPLARFPLDGAIIFADLMSPVTALGLNVRFDPGPVIDRPVRAGADVDALRVPAPGEVAPEVMAALRLVRQELGGRATLLGFAGSPWSLAAYLVQGRGAPGFPALRLMAVRDPGLLDALLTRLTELVIGYVAAQVAAGAQAIQIFDTWAGLQSLAHWTVRVRPHLERLVRATAELGVPRIMFAQDASHLVPAYAALGAEALAVDWREDMGALRATLGPNYPLQGNLDPAVMAAGPDVATRATRELLARVPRRAHVVNLGHGITPDGSIDAVHALIDVVHREGEG